MKKILYIDTSRPSSEDSIGGSINSMLNMVLAVMDEGYKVVILLFYHLPRVEQFCKTYQIEYIYFELVRPSSQANKGKQLQLKPRGQSSVLKLAYIAKHWKKVRSIVDLIKSNKIDIVHGNNRILANTLCSVAASITGVPYVQHQRDYDSKLLLIDRLLLKQSRVLSISKSIDENIRQIGIRDGMSQVLHNWVIDEYNSTTTVEKGRLIWIGRLVPWKGLEVLIKACSLPAFPKLEIDVYGEFDDADYKKKISDLLAEYNIAERFHFKGYVQFSNIDLSRYSTYIHTSVRPEPFGRTIIECMASGVPVIATQMGGVLDIIEHGKSGYMYDPDDIVALTSLVRNMMEHQSERNKICSEAITRVSERFSGRLQKIQLRQIYKEILS